MRFLREQFFNDEDEVVWVRTTALKHTTPPPFNSFTLYGNEDAPAQLDLYGSTDPLYNDHPVAVYSRNESGDLQLKEKTK